MSVAPDTVTPTYKLRKTACSWSAKKVGLYGTAVEPTREISKKRLNGGSYLKCARIFIIVNPFALNLYFIQESPTDDKSANCDFQINIIMMMLYQ
jgi:hypothetical protein